MCVQGSRGESVKPEILDDETSNSQEVYMGNWSLGQLGRILERGPDMWPRTWGLVHTGPQGRTPVSKQRHHARSRAQHGQMHPTGPMESPLRVRYSRQQPGTFHSEGGRPWTVTLGNGNNAVEFREPRQQTSEALQRAHRAEAGERRKGFRDWDGDLTPADTFPPGRGCSPGAKGLVSNHNHIITGSQVNTPYRN